MSGRSFELLMGATATGPGSYIDLGETVDKHTLSAEYTDADNGISALGIALQSTLDPISAIHAGTATWFTVVTHNFSAAEITAKKAMWHIIDKPLDIIRANIITATGIGAGDTVNIRYKKGR